MKMNVLLTGGLGYIGSHTAMELLREGHDVCIIDNLSNSDMSILKRIEMLSGRTVPFFASDLCDKASLDELRGVKFDAVIHFAAKKSISESLNYPLSYYQNNISGLINLLEFMAEMEIEHLVFSSSCTVYGIPNQIPVTEAEPTKGATSPYGNTKRWAEEILVEYTQLSTNLKTIILRYFNPVGADASGELGEIPNGTPNNLMPYITQTASGIRSCLNIFGSDYKTPDGTAIRDYIHVTDVAKAHVAALQYATKMKSLNYEVFNIGTGKGVSVLEIVKAFETVNQITLNYRFSERRSGDLGEIWAVVDKAKTHLNWKAELGLKEMVRSAWNWQKKLNKSDQR